MAPVLNKIKQETKNINVELRQRTLGFIAAGLGLVAGLAWNDAIKALIEHLLPLGKDTVVAKFIYAIAISIVVVIFSVYLTRLFAQKTKDTDSDSSAPRR